MIYLDYNATTPVDNKILEAVLPFFKDNFGNASSAHALGLKAARAVEAAREKVADFIGADAEEIIFTSGATEAVNLAIKGLYDMYGDKKNHVITVATEHSAVLDTCKYLETKGAVVDYLPVDKNGLIELKSLEEKITDNTLLLSVMHANNETGVLQPIKEIGEIAKKRNVFFFSDTTQSAGKLPINVHDLNTDMLCLSAHKMYGMKGVGALYVRRKKPRVNIAMQLHGGGHERKRRSGTLNVPGIVALAKSLELFNKDEKERIKFLRNLLENSLLAMDGVSLNGHKEQRIFNVSNVSFDGVNGKIFLSNLQQKLCVSAGSACHASSNEPSHVLTAMGVDKALAANSIRFSVGRFTTEEEIEKTIAWVKTKYTELKK